MKETLYDECVARGIPIENHESDLYIPLNSETMELLKFYGCRGELFANQEDKTTWIDIPFAYLPWWRDKL